MRQSARLTNFSEVANFAAHMTGEVKGRALLVAARKKSLPTSWACLLANSGVSVLGDASVTPG